MAIDVRQPEVDNAACVLVSVREETEPVVNAYLAMLWGIHGDVRIAHATDSYKFGTRGGEVLVQIFFHVLDRPWHTRKEAQLVFVKISQRPEEVHVVLVDFGGHIT